MWLKILNQRQINSTKTTVLHYDNASSEVHVGDLLSCPMKMIRFSQIYNKLYNKGRSVVAPHDNTIVILILMELKQMINDGLKPLSEKFDLTVKNFEEEIEILKRNYYNKKTQKSKSARSTFNLS